MTEPPARGTPAAPGASTEIELLASLQIFGVPVDASATFGTGIDTILAARFGGLTLGEVLEYLVNKAEPGLDFKLTPPWDLLNTISLHNFLFEIDITNFRIGFRYDDLDVSFPLVSLDRVEVWYSPATRSRNKSVDLSLFGSFLGVDFTREPGLTWDVLSQPAPSVPGQGTKYFDLEYLGIGQHVTLRDTASLTTLAQVIQALEGSYQNVDPHSNPLATLTALKFDGSSGWLFGAKFSALETVTLSAVFNDPVLYGLRLALDGKRVGKLAGLEFEILYRKVNDNLGVFHIELKLPDALRKIQAGEANITLPIIDLDVYTNGDFLLDLGFPAGLDFSRSFQIDLIVWVGPIPIPVSAAAGLYFGVLSGATSSQVPQVTNGSFAPVIVAGFGIEIGLGKSVSIGPLDAGFFAGFIGILEGVLAWFHPDSDPASTAVYFKVIGTVGIQIHIWGTVNFAILQASLDINAYATATVVIESYQPTEVSFEAGISISLSVKVLFFSITLSFSATISESFTIGQAAPTPWVIGAAQSAPQQPAARGIRRSTGGVVQANAVFAHVLSKGIRWQGEPALAAAAQPPLTLGVYVQPMLTAGLAGDHPGGTMEPQPQAQLVATLFVADRGQMEGALAVASADQPLGTGIPLRGPDGAPLTGPDGQPVETKQGDTFRKLVNANPAATDIFSLGFANRTAPGLLPQGTAIILPDGMVTLDAGGYTVPTGTETLSSIAAQLLSPFDQLTREALLWAVESAQLSVQQAQAALGGPAEPAAPGPDTPVSASHLHALYVELTNPAAPFPLSRVVDFLTSRAITFDLRPMPAAAPQNPSFTVFPMPPFLQLTAGGTSIDFGTGPFRATPAYQQYLARYIQQLAAPAPATPASPAAPAAAAQPAAVTDGQPDSVAAVLFTDYFVFILRQLVQDALDLYRDYAYQVPPGSTDTLASIANQFGISDPELVELNRDVAGLLVAGQTITFAGGDTVTTQPGDTFGDLIDRSRHSVSDLAAAAGAQPGLLRPGAVFSLVGGGSYVVAAGDTLLGIATTRQTAVTDEAAVARIAEANKTSATFFAPGAQLAINQRSTRVVGGETLRTLSARLQLTPLLVALAIRRSTGVLAVGSMIQVSGGSYVVGEGNTVRSIAARLAAPLDTVVGAAAAVPTLLKPLTTLALPGGSYVVRLADTLASIAAAAGVTLAEVGAAAADVADLLFAGVGFPLPTLPWAVAAASSADPATAESLDAIVARFGTTLAAAVAGANADALLLSTGAPVTFGLSTQIRPGESLTQLAQRFGLATADLAVALGDQTGLLAPGATLTVNPPPSSSGPQPAPASYVIKHDDTLTSIAASFGTSTEAVFAANPAVNCQPGQPCWSPTPDASLPRPGMGISVPVGLRIRLPYGLSYPAGSQDTLAGIAARFGIGITDLVAVPANANAEGLLAAQATVVLPPVSYQVADGDTPLSVAARFGLTVEQLVLANQDTGFGTVAVPDAEQLPLSTLADDLARAGSFAKPAGSLARFLLHGLRLPSPDEIPPTGTPGPDPADQPLYPMYTLTGQQLTPPDPLPDGYGLTLAPNGASPRPALTFAGGAGPLAVPLSPDDQAALAGIAGQLTQSPPIDTGVLAATRYPPYAVVPRQYALGKPVPWQAAAQPPLRYDPAGTGTAPAPRAAAGQPTLLPFPNALRHRIAASADAAGPGLRIGLASGSKAAPAAATQTSAIDGFGWATKVDFGLRRAPDPNAPGQPLPHVYEVFGVDQDATADLQQLLDYARGAGGGGSLTLALLYPLSPATAAGPALRSDPVDPAGVLLVKANLSTQSNPPAAASAALRALAMPQDGGAVTAATMSPADARAFLTLLWEAAVTNTGGYYLFYRVGPDGTGLPASLFNQDPTTTVSLLVTAFPEGGGSSTIPLRAFHNTALVTDNLADPNAAVFAVPPQLPLPASPATLAGLAASLGTSVQSLGAANATTANLLVPGQQITVESESHTVQPGDDILAVALALGVSTDAVVQAIATDPRYFTPGGLAEVYPEWLTVRGSVQPGAAGFRLVRTDPDPTASDPEAPRPAPGAPQDPKTRLEVLFNLVGYQLVAAGGFRASADGLPAGPARPTSGPLNYQLTAIAGVEPWIYEKQLRIDRFATSQPAAALDSQQDPYAGIGTTARFGWQPQDVFGNRLLPQQDVGVDVGYTDDLVALSQWPSVITGYQFGGQPGAATLQLSVALDTSAYVPTPGEVFAPVTGTGATGVPTGIVAQATAHRDRYAAIFWQVTRDLAAEVTTTVDGEAPHPLDVTGLAAFASGAWDYLATVASTAQLTAATAAGDTVASIASTYEVSPAELVQANRSASQNLTAADLLTPGATLALEIRYTVVQNDTLAAIAQRSPGAAPATPAGLGAGNPALALQPGTRLAVGTPRTVTAGDTLAGIAGAAGLGRTQLASANGPVPGLLAPGTALTLPPAASAYLVAAADTLAGIAGRSNLTLGEVAAAVDAAGAAALVSGAQIVIPVPVTIAAGDTPAGIAARFGVSVAELGETNADADVLNTGARIQLPDGSQDTIAAHDTLGSIAAAQGLTAGALAAANAESTVLLRPGTLSSGYGARAGDTLASVAAAFGVTAADAGGANAYVPGLLAPDQSVLLGHSSYAVQAGDTFASIAAITGATVAGIAAANATTTGLLTAGQTVAIPRHVVLGGTGPHQVASGETLAAIAGRSGVQVTALGSANSDVTGLLASGVQLGYTPPGGRGYSTATAPHDTLSTVALRLQGMFAADGVTQQLTAALLAEANQTVACLAPGAALLVPPADVTFSAPVTASNPAVVFPLQTAVTLRRTANVDPALAAAPAVTSVTTPLAPALPEGVAGQTLALQQFATAFEAAFSQPPPSQPQLKLTTTGSGSSGTRTQQLLAVRYGTAALNFTIAGATPSFFAPRPLSTALWSSPGPIPIRGYARGQLLGPAQPTSFTGADLDGWAQAFLAQLDLVLSSDYAIAAYTLDPAGYTALVQAKHTLAAAVRDSVDVVLQAAPGPGADLAAAQDALYQRLLVTLSAAYQVDTIVQLPVTVTAPDGWTGDTAPRLRGQPLAATYTVPAGGTLRSVAADFQAPLELLVTVLAGYPYLLAPGAVIPSQGSYRIADGDTLASVAARFATPVPALGAAVADVAGLLAAGVQIPLSRGGSYTTAPGDTLARIAAAEGLTVAGLAADAGPVPGLLVAGVVIEMPAYIVASGDTLASVTAHFPVTVAELGSALADTAGLLEPGAAVNLVRRSYPLAGDDTVFTAISYLALNISTVGAQADAVNNFAAMNATLPDLFAAGTTLLVPQPVTVAAGDTITGLAIAHGLTPLQLATSIAARTDVLAAGVVITLPAPDSTGLTVTTRPGDSLDSIAATAGLPLNAVGSAVQDLAGLLVPGVTIALPGIGNQTSYPVQPGDTLTTIAAAVGHGATPSWIVTTQLHTAQALRARTTVAYLSRVAGFSLSDAKISLVDSQHAPSPPNSLTFLFHTASNTAFSNLALQLRYQVNQIEYGIQDVAWATGYQSSQWLTFLLPPADAPIGMVDVPVPLRAHPVPPSVTSQQTTPFTASHAVGPADTIARVARAVGASTVASAGTLLRPGAVLELPDPARAEPVTHQVRAGESLAAVAGQHAVDAGHLLALNAHVPGLVQVGAQVGADGPPTVQQLRRYDYDYTFSTQRAAQDNVSTSQLQNTLLADGTPLTAPAADLPTALGQYATVRDGLEQDLALLTGVNPVAPVTVRIAAGDTLAALSQAAGVDVGYLGGVNAGLAGLLPAGTTVTVGGQSVTVAAGDTLAGIAARLGVDVDPVAAAVASLPLATGVVLTRPLPGNELAWRALRVFTLLAGQVAEAWAASVAAGAAPGPAGAVSPAPSPAVGAVPQHAPRFQVRRGTLATGEPTVQLLPDGAAAAVHANDLVVGLRGHVPADGRSAAGQRPVTFTRLARPQAAAPGAPPVSLPGFDDFDVLVPDRDVVTTQNIWGEVSVTRNANLLAGRKTNPAFVYSVPDVKAATPAVPLISWTDPFDLASVPFDPPSAPPGTGSATGAGGTRPLVDWLINFFDALLNRYAIVAGDTLDKIAMRYDLTPADLSPAVANVPGLLVTGAEIALPADSHQVAGGDTLASIAAATSVPLPNVVQAAAGVGGLLAAGVLIRPAAVARNLRVAVDYGFPLATAATVAPGQQGEIVSRLPVLLRPTFLFDSATDLQPGSGFCASLAQQLAAWAGGRGLPAGAGRWVLDVSLYTTLPGTAGTSPAQALPLLEMTDLRLARSLVQPDPAPQAPPSAAPTPKEVP